MLEQPVNTMVIGMQNPYCCMSLTTHTDSGKKLDIELICNPIFDSATASYNFTATFTVPKLINVAINNFNAIFQQVPSKYAPIPSRPVRKTVNTKVCQNRSHSQSIHLTLYH